MVYVIECVLPNSRIGCLIPLTKQVKFEKDAKLSEHENNQLFKFIDQNGVCKHVNANELSVLLQFEYCYYLKFLHESMLRNYYFWSINSDDTNETEDQIPSTESAGFREQVECGLINGCVSIRHIGIVNNINVGYGLYADSAIAGSSLIGEYVGIVMPSNTMEKGDYSLIYPSNESYVINASDVGNAIRLVNHSNNPNAEFKQFDHEGMIHILCVTLRDVDIDEQITVNYGTAYWLRQGYDPVEVAR